MAKKPNPSVESVTADREKALSMMSVSHETCIGVTIMRFYVGNHNKMLDCYIVYCVDCYGDETIEKIYYGENAYYDAHMTCENLNNRA